MFTETKCSHYAVNPKEKHEFTFTPCVLHMCARGSPVRKTYLSSLCLHYIVKSIPATTLKERMGGLIETHAKRVKIDMFVLTMTHE